MKTHYVYELFNLVGTIEYVGHTLNTKSRLYEHKSKRGKFHKRTDISMNIVKGFDNRKDAYAYQCKLQKEYSLETDSEINSKSKKNTIYSAERIEQLKKARNNRVYTPLSDETKQKMKETCRSRYSTTNV